MESDSEKRPKKRRRRMPTPDDPLAGMGSDDDDGGGGYRSDRSAAPRYQQQMLDASFSMRAGVPAVDPGNYHKADGTGDYHAVPFRSEKWDSVNAHNKQTIPGILPYWGVCQLCLLGQDEDEKEAWEELEKIKSFPERHVHDMDPIAMATTMHSMYDKDIKEFVENNPPMRTEMFWIHAEQHAPTIRFMIESSLRTINETIHTIRDGQLMERHSGTGHTRINPAAAKLLIQMEKEKKPIMKAAQEMRSLIPTGK